jgi:hypothetical protein
MGRSQNQTPKRHRRIASLLRPNKIRTSPKKTPYPTTPPYSKVIDRIHGRDNVSSQPR